MLRRAGGVRSSFLRAVYESAICCRSPNRRPDEPAVDQTCAAAPLPELLKGHVARRRPPRCLAAKQMDPPGPPGAAGHWRLEDNSFLWDPRNMVRMTRRGQASASRCPLDKLAGAAGASSARSRRFPRLRAAAVGLMRRSRGRWRYLVAARRQTRKLQPALLSPAQDQRAGAASSVRRSAGGAARGKSAQRVEKKCQARSFLCEAPLCTFTRCAALLLC